MFVNVYGGEISEAEQQAYIDLAMEKYKGLLEGLDIHVRDEEEVTLTYHLAHTPCFTRSRSSARLASFHLSSVPTR